MSVSVEGGKINFPFSLYVATQNFVHNVLQQFIMYVQRIQIQLCELNSLFSESYKM